MNSDLKEAAPTECFTLKDLNYRGEDRRRRERKGSATQERMGSAETGLERLGKAGMARNGVDRFGFA